MVREAWGLGTAPVRDVQELIEAKTGVDVGVVGMPTGVAGICVTEQIGGVAVILANSENQSRERQRFTLAHELGHLIVGDTSRVERSDTHSNSKSEVRANAFARHLLLPAAGIYAWLDGRDATNPETLAGLARYFGVSHTVALIQLWNLKLVTAAERRLLEGVTAREAAARHGWFDQWRADEAGAHVRRVPSRLWQRAVHAYESGEIGIGTLARLAGVAADDMRDRLAAAGITPLEVSQ